MEYLGDTLEAIAGEKAGIIKRGVPLVCGRIAPGPLAVIQRRARELHAPEHLLGQDFHAEMRGDALAPCLFTGMLGGREIPIGLVGAHQVDNAAVALRTAQLLQDRLGMLSAEAMMRGLSMARWPGRMERVLAQPPVWMDIAHNPAGARTIAALGGPWNILLAVSKDKDAPGMIGALAPVAKRFILTQYSGARSGGVSWLATAALRAGVPYEFHARMEEALAAGLSLAAHDAPLLVTGSIFAVGEAREVLIKRHGAPDLQF
jgi:dihydrofolate synthase/folylpolyglutamate synthase